MSPLDPIFWTHHNILDYLWYNWNAVRNNPNTNDAGWTGFDLAGMFVDGEFSGGEGGTLKTVNPADEEVLAEVAVAGEADVDRAVAAARRAYETTWGPMPGRDRAKYLFRIARIVQDIELREDYIIPSVFNRDVAPAVAEAVAEEARTSGMAGGDENTIGFAAIDEQRMRPSTV